MLRELIRNETERKALTAHFKEHCPSFPDDYIEPSFPSYVYYSKEETGWGNPIIVYEQLTLADVEAMIERMKSST